MNITRENLSDLDLCIRVDIEEADYAEQVKGQLKKYRKQVNMPGFRKGMVPQGMVDRMYRSSVTAEEVQNLLFSKLYEYIDNEKLEIVGSPMNNEEKTGKIDFDNAKSFTFYFDAAIMPEVKIDWSKLTTKMAEVKVDKKIVDEQIEHIAMQHGKFETPEEIGENDYVYGKYVEVDNEGKEVEGGRNSFCSFEMKSVKGEDNRNALLGKKKEDKVVLNVGKAFSAESIENIFHIEADEAKKFKSNIELTISGCSRITPHEVNEELFSLAFPNKEVKDEAEFRNIIHGEVVEMYNEQCNILYANSTHKELVEKFDAPIPENFLKRWILSRGEKEITAEKLEAEWAEKYIPSLKWEFITHALNKIKNIEPTREELIEECKNIIRNNGGVPTEGDEKEKEEALQKIAESVVSDSKNTQQISDRIYNNKLVALLKEQAKPEVEKISKKEFEARIKEQNKQ